MEKSKSAVFLPHVFAVHFKGRNFRDFAVFDPFRESLCDVFYFIMLVGSGVLCTL